MYFLKTTLHLLEGLFAQYCPKAISCFILWKAESFGHCCICMIMFSSYDYLGVLWCEDWRERRWQNCNRIVWKSCPKDCWELHCFGNWWSMFVVSSLILLNDISVVNCFSSVFSPIFHSVNKSERKREPSNGPSSSVYISDPFQLCDQFTWGQIRVSWTMRNFVDCSC